MCSIVFSGSKLVDPWGDVRGGRPEVQRRPLVMSTTGGLGREFDKTLKQLAEKKAKKTGYSYDQCIRYLRLRLSFAMVRSVTISIRGHRGRLRAEGSSGRDDNIEEEAGKLGDQVKKLQYPRTLNCEFKEFSPLSEESLRSLVRDMLHKACDLDPMPTSFVTKLLPELSPVITTVVNKSLANGEFPTALKVAQIRPSYKQDDKNDLKNYRPVSPVAFYKKVAANRMSQHLIRSHSAVAAAAAAVVLLSFFNHSASNFSL
eukprot:sb/3468484/